VSAPRREKVDCPRAPTWVAAKKTKQDIWRGVHFEGREPLVGDSTGSRRPPPRIFFPGVWGRRKKLHDPTFPPGCRKQAVLRVGRMSTAANGWNPEMALEETTNGTSAGFGRHASAGNNIARTSRRFPEEEESRAGADESLLYFGRRLGTVN